MTEFKLTLDKNTGLSVFSMDKIFIGTAENGVVQAAIENDELIEFKFVDGQFENNQYHLNYRSKNYTLQETCEEICSGVYKIARKWTNVSEIPSISQFIFKANAHYCPTFHMIPCVSYNGNIASDGDEPKGLTHKNKPWIIPYDRIGLPSASFSENEEHSVGLFSDPFCDSSMRSSCSMEKQGDTFSHILFWPKIEKPVSYKAKDKFSTATQEFITLQPQESFEASFYLIVDDVEVSPYGWTKSYDFIIDTIHPRPSENFYEEDTWNLSLDFVKNCLYEHKDNKSLTNIGLLPNGRHDVKASATTKWECRKRGKYEIGWCGQNVLFANALIEDYLKSESTSSLEYARQILSTWVKGEDNGLPLFAANKFDDNMELNASANCVDTCNLGWGAWQLLECYDKLQQIGIHDYQILRMAAKVCDFFVEKIQRDIIPGRLWTLDGKCLDESGTIGVFILLPLIKIYNLDCGSAYLEAAEKIFKYYSKKYLDNMVCTAGALDTNCIDKETCWPLLKAGLDLYKITNNDIYLTQAKKAGYYLLSWMFHYDVKTPVDSDFNRYGYKTTGATSVSTQHHHLDPWGAAISYDWYRLGVMTNDERWKKRALLTWENALLCISDGSYKVHGSVRPKGSQNEAYFQSTWHFDLNEKNPEGLMNDWLVSWPCAFRLLTMMRTD